MERIVSVHACSPWLFINISLSLYRTSTFTAWIYFIGVIWRKALLKHYGRNADVNTTKKSFPELSSRRFNLKFQFTSKIYLQFVTCLLFIPKALVLELSWENNLSLMTLWLSAIWQCCLVGTSCSMVFWQLGTDPKQGMGMLGHTTAGIFLSWFASSLFPKCCRKKLSVPNLPDQSLWDLHEWRSLWAFEGEAGEPLSFPTAYLTLTGLTPLQPTGCTDLPNKDAQKTKGNLGNHDTFPPASCSVLNVSGLKIIYFILHLYLAQLIWNL